MNAADQRELAGLIDRRLIATLGLRPNNSPGWGRLVALKNMKLRSPDGELVEFKAGVTHVAYDYWAIRARPELFRVADRRDTHEQHRRALEHAKQDLERGTPTTRAAARGPSSTVLPPRPQTTAFRLPR